MMYAMPYREEDVTLVSVSVSVSVKGQGQVPLHPNISDDAALRTSPNVFHSRCPAAVGTSQITPAEQMVRGAQFAPLFDQLRTASDRDAITPEGDLRTELRLSFTTHVMHVLQ
jgi:hypothetical protein